MEKVAAASRNSGRARKKRPKDVAVLARAEPLENMTWRSLADTYRTVQSHIMSDLRHYGLTPPQYSVLRTIGRSQNGFLPMNEIGKEMIVTFANITTIVDNLEERRLVRRIRDTDDRRIVYVELTSGGSRLFAKIYKAHRKQVAMLMQALSDEELETVRKLTIKIRDNIALHPSKS
ncbi:MAG: MarR family winged helix-turn-helix transcriptional regulator [Nitrososphaerales archaeon]